MLPSRHDVSGRPLGNALRVTISAEGARRPSIRALTILAISALALLATSPGQPTLTGRAIGEAVVDGGESVERELRIHVDPAGGDAMSGSIHLTFQSASGLQSAYGRDATLSFVSASDSRGSFPPSTTFPVERCVSGCDLVYRILIAASPSVLPGSVVRYEVDVELRYDYSSAPRSQSLLRVDLDGLVTGPVAPIWALLAGVLALVGGVVVGPAFHRRLEPDRWRVASLALFVLAVGLIAWIFVDGALNLVSYDTLPVLARSPLLLLVVADPWSVILLGTLGWGVWRGLQRWPTDGGWLLGLSAVAMVGLGGLWLAWRSTMDAVVQPVLVAALFAMLGGVGGIVIGQAWRTDARADHDRWWAALAVLSHGILIAGFGFLAEQSLYDPFAWPSSPMSFLALIPAALVALAFRRWLRGRQRWLILFDLIIAGIGLFGLYLSSSSFIGVITTPARLEIDDVAVYLAVAAALVAAVTSFHPMRATAGSDREGAAASATVDPIGQVTPMATVDDPPTT
jgi:hypothetical protein